MPAFQLRYTEERDLAAMALAKEAAAGARQSLNDWILATIELRLAGPQPGQPVIVQNTPIQVSLPPGELTKPRTYFKEVPKVMTPARRNRKASLANGDFDPYVDGD